QASGGAGVLPDGIWAWTVDERRNAFRVCGSEKGIEELQRLLGLLDVPARSLRVTVRLVPMDAAAVAALKPPDPVTTGNDDGPAIVCAVLGAGQTAALEGRPAARGMDLVA